MWPEKATAIVAAGRSLQEVEGHRSITDQGCTVGSYRPRPSKCPFIRSRMMSRNSQRIEEDDQGGAIWSRRIKCIVACDKAPSDFLGPPI
jgi:hypothetical protein